MDVSAPRRAVPNSSCDTGDLACRRDLRDLAVCDHYRRDPGFFNLLHGGWRYRPDGQLDTVHRADFGFSHRNHPGDRIGDELSE